MAAHVKLEVLLGSGRRPYLSKFRPWPLRAPSRSRDIPITPGFLVGAHLPEESRSGIPIQPGVRLEEQETPSRERSFERVLGKKLGITDAGADVVIADIGLGCPGASIDR